MKMRVLLCCLVPALTSGAAEFFVEADGTGPYATISDAIFAAADDDTVTLGDGVYTGEGNRDLSNGDRILLIRSASGDPERCVIDCEGAPGDPHFGFWLSITGSRQGPRDVFGLEGLTVTGGFDYMGAALRVSDGAWPSAERCIFRGNVAQERGGAVALDESGLDLKDCLFLDNFAPMGGAVCFDYYASFHVSGCTFAGNGAEAGGAIFCRRTNWIFEMESCTFHANSAPLGAQLLLVDDAHVEMDRCILAFGLGGEALVCDAGCDATLACCDVFGNAGGDWAGCLEGQLGPDGNIAADPLFCDAEILDLTLDETSPCAPFSPPNEDCDLIGAWPVACGGTAAAAQTWSGLRRLYR